MIVEIFIGLNKKKKITHALTGRWAVFLGDESNSTLTKLV